MTDFHTALQEARARFSRLDWLDFSASDLLTAHHRLGRDVRAKAQEILRARLDRVDPSGLAQALERAQESQAALDERIASALTHPQIRAALAACRACLEAWAAGAGLLDAAQDHLHGRRFSALQLALWLHDDTTGCQTGLQRQPDGSVILWHTEEDGEPARFDRLRLLTFCLDDDRRTQVTSFIYPDLLPGPTFGWRDDLFLQAVDSLHVTSAGGPAPRLPVNLACWVSLYLGGQVGLDEIAAALSPFLDAAALNTVHVQGGQVQAARLECGGNLFFKDALPALPGSFLFETNACATPLAQIEHLRPGLREQLEERTRFTAASLETPADPQDPFPFFLKLIASTGLDDFSYANADVRACLVAQVHPGRLRIAVGGGPAGGEEPAAIHVTYPA